LKADLQRAATLLGVAVSTTSDKRVLITFDKCVSSIEMSQEDAQDFALSILDQVENAGQQQQLN
jgi:hypothetical protein